MILSNTKKNFDCKEVKKHRSHSQKFCIVKPFLNIANEIVETNKFNTQRIDSYKTSVLFPKEIARWFSTYFK